MASHFVQQLLASHPLVSDQVNTHELGIVLDECETALHRSEGDVTEFGCYTGTTSLFLARMLHAVAPERRLHVYDSFAGLPPKSAADRSPAGEQFQAGELAASKATLIRYFKQTGLPLPAIHKGWFREFSSRDLPSTIGFAFLDGDYYQSVTDSLRLVWPRLENGAAVVVDDYHNEALPGVQTAVDEWLADHPARLRAEASLAIMILSET